MEDTSHRYATEHGHHGAHEHGWKNERTQKANRTSDRGKHISFQRAKHTIRPNTSLIKIEGVDDTKAATFYNGKRIAYVYRGKTEVRGTKIRVIWGKVTRPHGMFFTTMNDMNGKERIADGSPGNSGVVRAQFKKNLPPKSLGAMVRIMLYPSSI
jgi:large subunit ribosomal protein L35Ae